MALHVTVDPLVALGIVDHHMRRTEDRVCGTLMGSRVQGSISVRNFLPTFDPEARALFSSSSPQEFTLGWYATGSDPEKDDQIHAGFDRIDSPVLLVIDVGMAMKGEGSMGIRALVKTTITLSGGAVGPFFRPVPCTIAATDPCTSVALRTLANPVEEGRHEALEQLRRSLVSIQQVLQEVVQKKRTGDPEFAHEVMKTLRGPNVTGEQLGQMFEKSSEANITLLYLQKLVRQQLLSMEKVHRQTVAPRNLGRPGPGYQGKEGAKEQQQQQPQQQQQQQQPTKAQ